LQFAKGLSAGISGNEGLSFIVNRVFGESYQDLFRVFDNDKLTERCIENVIS
jgi:hypothetical protein